MLDKKTEAVLQVLSEQAKDGYTVLQKQQLIALVPQKYQLDTKTFCSTISFLKEQGYVDVKYQDGQQLTLLNGRDVSPLIRTQEVGGAASAVSRYAPVRRMLVRRQQEMAAAQPMLLDGRDIGTVVLPDATVKIFLTASPEERARRRRLQLLDKGDNTPFEEVLAEVNARDLQDTTRELTPLRQADDAVLLDSSSLTFDETVQSILTLVEEKYGKQ